MSVTDIILAAAGQGSVTPPTTDPNFNQVALLLSGDGTNGAQNNTFLDSSTNNFTITRNGTPTQGTNTPFSQTSGYWSNYFNGSTDVLTIPSNSALQVPTQNFTMEGFIYLNAYPASSSSSTIMQKGLVGTSSFEYNFGIQNSTGTYYIQFIYSVNGTTQVILISTAITLSLSTWYHVAITRVGTTISFWFNGILKGTATTASTIFTSTSAFSLSGNSTATSVLLNGYASNARLVNGTAVYTSNFTPSTTPLTAITNTALLCCQSNYFKDNSSNNFTITPTGTPSVQPWSVWNPSSAYSTSVNGGSMSFNGTTDYLSLPTNTALNFGTGAFTLEAWVYLNNYSTGYQILYCGNSGGSIANCLQFYITSTGTVACAISTIAVIATTTTKVSLSTWNHLAITRSGNNFTIWINGVSSATGTNTATVTNNSTFYVGNNASSSYLSGYVSNLRMLKGTALYTTGFTPPTVPLTNITNTSLLLSGTNAGIFDSAIKNDLTTVGSAKVSTSTVKYGTGSMSFNGTTDYLTAPNSPQYAFNTGNWTIEGWIYPNSISVLQSIIDTRATATSTTGVLISITALGFISVTVNNAILFTSSTGLSLSTWTNFAVVKNGTTITLYLNGTKPTTGSGTSSTGLTDQNLRIGASAGTAANFFSGYLDDVRITTGIARYTANFTPPTAALPNY